MIAHRGKFFSYLRVSTDKQGERGHGLAAQRQAVLDHLDGGSWELLGEFVEVESGKRNDRPKLLAALAACKKHRARLIISKLDRLSRNVAFIAALMDSGVEFTCADFPQANRLTLHILAAVAEHEREAIAERTRAGLRAAKARGVVMGNRVNLAEAQAKGNATSRQRADTFARNVAPIVKEIQATGATTMRAVAAALAARGVRTARGGKWSAAQVANLLQRTQ